MIGAYVGLLILRHCACEMHVKTTFLSGFHSRLHVWLRPKDGRGLQKVCSLSQKHWTVCWEFVSSLAQSTYTSLEMVQLNEHNVHTYERQILLSPTPTGGKWATTIYVSDYIAWERPSTSTLKLCSHEQQAAQSRASHTCLYRINCIRNVYTRRCAPAIRMF